MSEFFDEMFNDDGSLRRSYEEIGRWFNAEDASRLRAKQHEAEKVFRLTGITFNVYGKAEAEERLIPFDIVPRVISAREWQRLERGIEQRVRAINAFLHDIYHRQEIVRAGRVPAEMIAGNDAENVPRTLQRDQCEECFGLPSQSETVSGSLRTTLCGRRTYCRSFDPWHL